MSVPELKGNLIVGLYQFFQNPIGYLQYHFDTVGDTYKFSLLGRTLVCTRDPKVMDHVFVKNHKNYNKDFSMEQIGLALGKGLLTNSGTSWFKQRRLAQPAFYKKRLEGLIEVMENHTDEYISTVKKLRSGHVITIDEAMMNLTATIVLETLMGEKMNDDMRNIQQSIASIQKYLVKRIRIPFYIQWSNINGDFKQFQEQLHEMDNIIYKLINRRRNSKTLDNNLIEMLMEATDVDTGERMSDKQLRDELITIYVAGHETSAYALSWTFYELMQHPEVVERIRKEVADIIVDGRIGSEGLKQLKYTASVVQESMRLHPPAYFISRSCVSDDQIDDVEIKKGEVVIISVYGMHRHPELWDEADVFKPERFLENNEATRKYYHPFGAGPRMCIGNNFAMMEITLILAKMIYHFDFKLYPYQKIDVEPLVTLKPKYGIKLIKL